jgi:hypothetical protein
MPVITGLHALPRAALHEHDHMTRDQRSALRRLAEVPRGLAETLMLAHGFTRELIKGLVLFGLATVVTDAVRIGERTIKVDLVMITDAGRRAIEG